MRNDIYTVCIFFAKPQKNNADWLLINIDLKNLGRFFKPSFGKYLIYAANHCGRLTMYNSSLVNAKTSWQNYESNHCCYCNHSPYIHSVNKRWKIIQLFCPMWCQGLLGDRSNYFCTEKKHKILKLFKMRNFYYVYCSYNHFRYSCSWNDFLSINRKSRIAFQLRRRPELALSTSQHPTTLWHRGLTCKLLLLPPDRHLAHMIMEMVGNRSFTLSTGNGKRSRVRRLKDGVPHGPVLAPFLLNIYISDLLTTVSQTWTVN